MGSRCWGGLWLRPGSSGISLGISGEGRSHSLLIWWWGGIHSSPADLTFPEPYSLSDLQRSYVRSAFILRCALITLGSVLFVSVNPAGNVSALTYTRSLGLAPPKTNTQARMHNITLMWYWGEAFPEAIGAQEGGGGEARRGGLHSAEEIKWRSSWKTDILILTYCDWILNPLICF